MSKSAFIRQSPPLASNAAAIGHTVHATPVLSRGRRPDRPDPDERQALWYWLRCSWANRLSTRDPFATAPAVEGLELLGRQVDDGSHVVVIISRHQMTWRHLPRRQPGGWHDAHCFERVPACWLGATKIRCPLPSASARRHAAPTLSYGRCAAECTADDDGRLAEVEAEA